MTFFKQVYVTGNARCPEKSTIGSVYEIFAVELIINLETDVIVDASCTLVTELGRQFVRNLLVERNIVKEINNIINDVNQYYQAVPQKTLVSALKDALNKYKLYKKSKFAPGEFA